MCKMEPAIALHTCLPCMAGTLQGAFVDIPETSQAIFPCIVKNTEAVHASCLRFFSCDGYPKLLVVSPKSTVGWNRGLTEILQNQLWDGIVGYSIKKWYKNQAIELLSVA